MRKTRWTSRTPRGIWPGDAGLQAILRMAQQGDPEAVNGLLERLRPLLVQYFAHDLDHDTAEDLAQDALVRLLNALPNVDPDRACRYVARLAQYRLRSACRQRARDVERFVPVTAALDVPAQDRADRGAEHEDMVRLVQRVTASPLSPKLRDCVLGLLSGLSLRELAGSKGVKPGTMRARLLLARHKLGHLRVEARRTLKEAGLARPWRVSEAVVAAYDPHLTLFRIAE
jgi:RNA polymerase sigma factor (sigma-70 family)